MYLNFTPRVLHSIQDNSPGLVKNLLTTVQMAEDEIDSQQ